MIDKFYTKLFLIVIVGFFLWCFFLYIFYLKLYIAKNTLRFEIYRVESFYKDIDLFHWDSLKQEINFKDWDLIFFEELILRDYDSMDGVEMGKLLIKIIDTFTIYDGRDIDIKEIHPFFENYQDLLSKLHFLTKIKLEEDFYKLITKRIRVYIWDIIFVYLFLVCLIFYYVF